MAVIVLSLLIGAGLGAAALAVAIWLRTRRRRRTRHGRSALDMLLNTLEHIDQGYCVFDADGGLQFWNQLYFFYTGVPAEAARDGLPVQAIVRYSAVHGSYGPGDFNDGDIERIAGEVMACNPARFEAHGLEGRNLEVRRYHMPDGGVAITISDITDQKRHERELERTSSDLQSVFASTDEGIAVLDPELRITAVNERMFELIGLPAQNFRVGMHITDYYRGRVRAGAYETADADVFIAERMALWESGRPFVVQSAGAEDRIVEFHVSVPEDGGRVVICRDVTAQRHYEQALREAKEQAELANRAKTEFLANTSHELRTPLNAIIGFSEVLMGEMYGTIGNAKYLEYARDIRDSGEHLLSLINDLLDLAKIESGHYELHEEPLSVSQLIDSCLRLVRERATTAEIEVQKEMDDERTTVFADQRALKQVLINLLSNAVKFTPAGGRLLVSSRHTEDGGLDIAVEDTGIGMDQQEIDTALAPFGQVDSTMSRRFEGTGLGLPLAQRLMENHGGVLEIESTKGAGTTVTAHLPPRRLVDHPSRALAR